MRSLRTRIRNTPTPEDVLVDRMVQAVIAQAARQPGPVTVTLFDPLKARHGVADINAKVYGLLKAGSLGIAERLQFRYVDPEDFFPSKGKPA